MLTIDQVQQLYIEYFSKKPFLEETRKREMKNELQRFINIIVRETPSKYLFKNLFLLDMLTSSLCHKAKDNSGVLLVEKAFKGLEKYFLLLAEQPWKLEFREIKLYGGFYKTKIKPAIANCELIFEKAGYEVTPEKHALTYKHPKDSKFLLLLAFDCKVSQMLCTVIVECYSSNGGPSMALCDVIMNILYNESSRDNPAVRKRVLQRNSLAESTSLGLKIVAPPAIPKRQPINSSSSMMLNNSFPGRELFSQNDYDKQCLANMQTGVTFPPRLPPRTYDMNSVSSRKPPSLSSNVIPEPLAYIDNNVDKTIIEGTLEDHLRESLRLVSNQSNQKLFLPNKPSEVLQTTPFSTGESWKNMQRLYKSDISYDEGIGSEISGKSIPHSSRGSFTSGQHVLPNKFPLNSQQGYLTNQSYDTGNPESIHSQASSSLDHNPYQPIYQPPNGDTYRAAFSRKMPLSRQNALPLHAASAELPPNTNKEYYYNQLPKIPYNLLQPVDINTQVPCGENLVQPFMTSSEYITLPKALQKSNILSQERTSVCKTSSLTTDLVNTAQTQQATALRMTHSMDIEYWQCPSCFRPNNSLSSSCIACSYNYLHNYSTQ